MSERIDTRARRLVKLKDERTKTDIAYKAADKSYRDEERNLWLDLEEEFGKVKTVTLDLGEGFGTIQLQRRETVTSTILDEEAAAVSLEEEEGLGEAALGPRKVRKRVLNEEVRDRLKSGRPLPAGVDFHARRFISVTRK